MTTMTLYYLLILVPFAELQNGLVQEWWIQRNYWITMTLYYLIHGEGVIEVACNLLDPKNVGGERVQKRDTAQTFHSKKLFTRGCLNREFDMGKLLSHTLRRFNPSGEFSFQCQIGLSFKGKLGD
jgi:hypothetical protein